MPPNGVLRLALLKCYYKSTKIKSQNITQTCIWGGKQPAVWCHEILGLGKSFQCGLWFRCPHPSILSSANMLENPIYITALQHGRSLAKGGKKMTVPKRIVHRVFIPLTQQSRLEPSPTGPTSWIPMDLASRRCRETRSSSWEVTDVPCLHTYFLTCNKEESLWESACQPVHAWGITQHALWLVNRTWSTPALPVHCGHTKWCSVLLGDSKSLQSPWANLFQTLPLSHSSGPLWFCLFAMDSLLPLKN